MGAGDGDGEAFALKRLSRAAVVSNGWQTMVGNEVSAMKELAGASPLVLQLHNVFWDQRYLYLLLPLCMGGDLYKLFLTHQARRKEERAAGGKRASRHLPDGLRESEARFYVACVAGALAAVHARHIVYRDLKPENVLLTHDGRVRVADFGLAKKAHRTYTVCGSVLYMAPEVILSSGHDQSADLWALGVLLFELVCGYTPFTGSTAVEVYEMVLAHESTKDLPFQEYVSARCRHLIGRLLHPKRAHRIGRGAEGMAALRKHPFFDGVDWNAVLQDTASPPLRPSGPDLVQRLAALGADRWTEERQAEVTAGSSPIDESGWEPAF